MVRARLSHELGMPLASLVMFGSGNDLKTIVSALGGTTRQTAFLTPTSPPDLGILSRVCHKRGDGEVFASLT